MNVVDFIFRLLHIRTRPILSVLTPLCLPYTCFTNYAHLSIDYESTFGECTYFFANFAHNFDDCANIPYNLMNIVIDLVHTLDKSYVDFYMPNFVLLQLLFLWRSKINTKFTVGSVICSLFSSFFICGFYN
jgi:hypothetical protein